MIRLCLPIGCLTIAVVTVLSCTKTNRAPTIKKPDQPPPAFSEGQRQTPTPVQNPPHSPIDPLPQELATGEIQIQFKLATQVDLANGPSTSWHPLKIDCDNAQLVSSSWQEGSQQISLTMKVPNLAMPVHCDSKLLIQNQDGIHFHGAVIIALQPESGRHYHDFPVVHLELAESANLKVTGTYRGFCPEPKRFSLESRRCED